MSTMNEQRADRGREIIDDHSDCNYTDDGTDGFVLDISDVIADLLHLCDRLGLDHDAVLDKARRSSRATSKTAGGSSPPDPHHHHAAPTRALPSGGARSALSTPAGAGSFWVDLGDGSSRMEDRPDRARKVPEALWNARQSMPGEVRGGWRKTGPISRSCEATWESICVVSCP